MVNFITVIYMTKFPANIYLFKFNSRDTRKSCEICSKLTIKTPEGRQWSRSGNITVNFKHISHLFLLFLLLTLNKSMPAVKSLYGDQYPKRA